MTTGLIHPQHYGPYTLWYDAEILTKIQQGDPTKGWEGDENLVVYFNGPLGCFELQRWEGGQYSLVARQKPGVVFDERIIEDLVRRDMFRKDRHYSLHDEIVEHNERVEAEHQARHNEMIAEEVAPRLRRSLIKEGWI